LARFRLSLHFLVLGVVAIAMPGPARAAFPKTVIVLADRITLDDLLGAQSPSLGQLLEKGAIGLMNPATGGPRTPDRALLVLGRGEHLTRLSLDTLDARLRQARVRVAHIGSVLLGKVQMRPAAGIAGATVWPPDATLPSDPARRTHAMAQALLRTLPFCDLCLVDLGDTTRIEAAPLPWAGHRHLQKRAIQRYEPLWKALLQVASRGTDIWILTPCPPVGPSGRWESLTPIVRIGKGRGLLTSGTTQTSGIVANIDFAPTLLRDFGLQVPPSMTGREMAVSPGKDRLRFLRHLDRMATLNDRALTPVMAGYGAFFVALLAACVIALSRSGIPSAWRVTLQAGLLCAGAVPLSLLLVSLCAPATVGQLALESVLLTAILAALTFLLAHKSRLSGLIWLFVGTSLAVIGDTVLHGPLVRDSVLSGFLLAGIRYYGLGNEYMGALLGAGLVAPALLMDELRLPKDGASAKIKIILGMWLALIAAAIGLPAWGANFGGAIAAAPACVLTWMALMGYHLERRSLLLAAIGLALLTGTFVMWDRMRGASSQTHIGRLLHQIQTQGGEPFREIVLGKLRMNLGFILSPAGWIPTVTSLIFLGWLILRLKSKIEQAFTIRPALQAILPAAGAGAVLALIANDSGIVPFGFIAGSWVYPLLDVMLGEGASREG